MNIVVRTSLLITLVAASVSCSSSGYTSFLRFGGDDEPKEAVLHRVDSLRTEVMDAQSEFTETFTLFTRLNSQKAGDLEDVFEEFKSEFEDCEEAAEKIKGEIEDLELEAEELFADWNRELDMFTSKEMRSMSEDMLRDVEASYVRMIEALKALRSAMIPVVVSYRDYVIFFNHNLNPRAISTLGEMNIRFVDDVAAFRLCLTAARTEMDAFLETCSGKQMPVAPQQPAK